MNGPTVYIGNSIVSYLTACPQILAEVRRIRNQVVAQHDDDLHTLCLAMRRREAQHPKRVRDLSKSRQRRGKQTA